MAYEVDNIRFAYTDKPVIEGISVSLARGRFYGIVGPNGCGKSTLLDLLVGHKTPASGSIRYNGRDLAAYGKRELSRQLALVPQNFYINFPFTSREVVMMGRYPHMPRFARPSAEDIRVVDEIMEKTGTHGFSHRFITELSGGERQRVVLARALAQATPFIFLDEATSNLDVQHTLGLLNIIKGAVERKEKTVVAVMQNLNLAALYCDALMFMKQGRITAFGPAEAVLSADTIRSVFHVEAKVYYDAYAASNQIVFRR